MVLSLSKRILRYVKQYPFQTNIRLAKKLKADPAQVSSVTNKLYKVGKISRNKESTTTTWLYWVAFK